MDERAGGRMSSWKRFALVVFGLVDVAIITVLCMVLPERLRERRKEQDTRARLQHYASMLHDEREGYLGSPWMDPRGRQGSFMFGQPILANAPQPEPPVDDKDMPHYTSLDAWGRELRFAFPGPVHRRGWDMWSVGANGVDERGEGDDILVGEDLVGVAATTSRS